MSMGLRTELAVARAVDKGDLDPVSVHPLPAREAILAAMDRLGFRFKGADLELGRIRGVSQTLPFYQEIEYFAAPQYAHALTELELTFVANPHAVDVILEVDKRGGLFSGGHDVYHHVQVPHADGGQVDRAAQIDAWLQQSVLAYAGHGGFGHPHEHGHPHGRGHHGGGFGAAAMVAGVGAGLVGGYLAGEAIDEVFDAGDEE
jgi:sporulation-control protein